MKTPINENNDMENLEITSECQITSDFIGECCGISFDEFNEFFFRR